MMVDFFGHIGSLHLADGPRGSRQASNLVGVLGYLQKRAGAELRVLNRR
jgi:hypothetical protein